MRNRSKVISITMSKFTVFLSFFAVCLCNIYDVEGRQNARPGFIWVCRQEPVDIAFVLDASNSIWDANFTKGLEFIHDFLTRYDFGPEQARAGAVLYSQGVFPRESFGFNAHSNKSELLQAILDLPYVGGYQTDTGLGIRYMRKRIMRNARPEVPHIGVVLTDGQSHDKALTALEAALARSEGIMMFAIGVGMHVSFQELINIAGNPDNAFNVHNYEALQSIKDKLEYRTCVEKIGPTPPPPPCGERNPSNIVFVMDVPSMSENGVASATSFMSEVMRHADMESGMQYAVITGACPGDAGIQLGQYHDPDELLSRISAGPSNRMDRLLNQANSMLTGGRNASEHAVVFYERHVNVSEALRQFHDAFPNTVQVTMAVVAESGASPLGHVFDNVRLASDDDLAALGRQFVEELCAFDEPEIESETDNESEVYL